MLTIDLHTHILPEHWPDWTQRSGYPGWIALEHLAIQGPGTCGCARMCQSLPDGGKRFFREIQANCWDPALRLSECDARGVDAQVLSTVPVMFAYWARARDALDLARLLNDHIAGVCRMHPTRFAGLATIPLQDVDLACRELERCVGAQSPLGLAGVQIGTHVGGVNLGEPSLLPVFETAERLGACVFVHPWDMLAPPAAPTAATVPAPPDSPGRFAKYWMPWLIGMPTETCIAIYSILASGLLDRCPRLRVCFAHGGGSFPGTIGRLQHGYEARPDLCAADNPRGPREYLAKTLPRGGVEPARFYVDSLTHDADALRQLIRLFTPDRIALGSDYPFPLGEEHPGALIRELGDLGASARARMLGGTALEFLGAGGAGLANR